VLVKASITGGNIRAVAMRLASSLFEQTDANMLGMSGRAESWVVQNTLNQRVEHKCIILRRQDFNHEQSFDQDWTVTV
jgi:hypothetical protein